MKRAIARSAIARRRMNASAAVVLAAVGLALLGGCAGKTQHDVRVLILNEAGDPVPGTVFYAEAYDADGPFAFLSARAGSAGEVPDSAREPAKIAWRPGAKIALAAFAPGYLPVVHRDPEGDVRSDETVLILLSAGGGPAWDPAVANLGFPFPDRPELAAEAAAASHDPLREALLRAWQARISVPPALTAAEERKISALKGKD